MRRRCYFGLYIGFVLCTVSFILRLTCLGADLPDLSIAAGLGKAMYSPGQKVAVPVAVFKFGGPLRYGRYVLARLYWSRDKILDRTDTLLWESNGSKPDYPVEYLNRYRSKTVVPTIRIPQVPPARYYIIAIVNPNRYHPESNFSNNLVVYTISVHAVSSADPCKKYYGKGYCTDYIRTKVRVPWRGNAISWLKKARAYGYRTGEKPKVRSIAVFSYAYPYGHVAWVEEVSKDGRSFKVSHWNWGRKIDNCYRTVNFRKKTYKWFQTNDPHLLGFIYIK